MSLDPHLRSIIVCPQCRGALTDSTSTAGQLELVCASCALAYPVIDEIPVLLLDEARPTG